MRFFGILLSLVLMTSVTYEAHAWGVIPTELLTPDLVAFLKTDEGKELWAAATNSLRAEYEKNKADPELTEYYRFLKTKDFDAAFKTIKGPAVAGHPQAQTELAYLYMTGSGVQKDINEAIKWDRSASEKGNTMATANLAAIYLFPQFGKQDIRMAMQLFRKCAIKLRPSCITNLSSLYVADDTPAFSLPKAYAWAALGVDEGVPGARQLMEQYGPYMQSDDFAVAAKEKSAIVHEIMGK